MTESAWVGERDNEELMSLDWAMLLGPVGPVADESKLFIMACSSLCRPGKLSNREAEAGLLQHPEARNRSGGKRPNRCREF